MMETQRTEVIEQTREARDRLSRFAHALTTADTPGANECTDLAAGLRRLARMIDRYAAGCPAGVARREVRAAGSSECRIRSTTAAPDTAHVWVFPGERG